MITIHFEPEEITRLLDQLHLLKQMVTTEQSKFPAHSEEGQESIEVGRRVLVGVDKSIDKLTGK